MTSLGIAFTTLACMLGGMSFGLLLHYVLPEHHRQDESKDVMKTAAGMMATLVALIIGLLVSSAKSSFDSTSATITQGGAKIITLDRILSRFGPEAASVREHLRHVVESGIERIWPSDTTQRADMRAAIAATGMEDVYDKVRELPAQNESQQYLKSQALQLAGDMMQSRWLMIEQSQNSLPSIFLIVLTFWLTVLFTCFGLLAPRNVTAITSVIICAVSMSGAVFLILELNRPLEGSIKVSSAPLRKALSIIGK